MNRFCVCCANLRPVKRGGDWWTGPIFGGLVFFILTVGAGAQQARESSTTEAADGEKVVEMEEFSIESEVAKGSSADLKMERKNADVSIDFLSSTDLSKFKAGDLAEVVFRIPGVSVANGRFAVVRGLSDRFLTTTLQGIKLPSPDPEKQAVQLDLLPVSAVEAIVVSKTFQASQWAESSGGNVDLVPRGIPEEKWFRVGLEVKLDANALDGGVDYPIRGKWNERFGFGSRSRIEVGSGDPTWEYVPSRRDHFPLGNKFSMEFARTIPIGEDKMGILFSAFSDASFKSREGLKQQRGALRGVPASEGGPSPLPGRPPRPPTPGRPSDFETDPPFPRAAGTIWDYSESESENVLGLSMGVGYRFSPDDELKLSALFVQSGLDLSQLNETALAPDPSSGRLLPVENAFNFSGAENFSLFNGFEYFRERNLTVFQLSGRNKLPILDTLGISWALQRGSTYQKDHPFIETFFASPLDDLHHSYVLLAGNDPPRPLDVVWADNQETQNAGRVDFELPFRVSDESFAILKFGGAFERTEREVDGTARFYNSPSDGNVVGPDPNELFQEFVGSASAIPFSSVTTASRETAAFFGNVTIPFGKRLKLMAGARYEDFSLSSTGVGQWGVYTSGNFYDDTVASGGYGSILGTNSKGAPPFSEGRWYPGASVIVTPSDSLTLRLSYSSTSGRPSLREVSSFFNKRIESENLAIGNPGLVPSDVESYDVRVEWSPNVTNFVSISFFRKLIENPIEKYLFDTRAGAGFKTESWVNNPVTAAMNGVELEFRHSLGAWSDALRDFTLSGNATWIDAEVDQHPVVVVNAVRTFQDPAKLPPTRRLFDQPEYIANLDVTWSHAPWGSSATLAGYAISDVLTTAGLGDFSFDLYERSFLRVDFLWNQQLTRRLKAKFAVVNLTDPTRGTVYDRGILTTVVERNSYRLGRGFSIALSADF